MGRICILNGARVSSRANETVTSEPLSSIKILWQHYQTNRFVSSVHGREEKIMFAGRCLMERMRCVFVQGD